MFRSTVLFAAAAMLGGILMVASTPADAQSSSYREGVVKKNGKYNKKQAKRRYRSARVRRGGGYSYSYYDSINTYGDGTGRYGSAWRFRVPGYGRQTTSGPFDSGFFFDSGLLPRGGDSPYIN